MLLPFFVLSRSPVSQEGRIPFWLLRPSRLLAMGLTLRQSGSKSPLFSFHHPLWSRRPCFLSLADGFNHAIALLLGYEILFFFFFLLFCVQRISHLSSRSEWEMLHESNKTAAVGYWAVSDCIALHKRGGGKTNTGGPTGRPVGRSVGATEEKEEGRGVGFVSGRLFVFHFYPISLYIFPRFSLLFPLRWWCMRLSFSRFLSICLIKQRYVKYI